MKALTQEQATRVNIEIIRTQKTLQKQLNYSKDLQDKGIITMLSSHIDSLKLMLINGWDAPVFI